MEPFEVLIDEADLPTIPLPAELARAYGGDLTLADDCVYANFVATIDGVVAIPAIPGSNALIAGDNDADRFLMGILRAVADAVLIGAGVLRASPKGTWRAEKIHPPAAEAYRELRASLGLPETPEIAILTGSGSIDPSHPVLGGRAVVLTSHAGAARLADEVPDATTVVSLGPETRFDGAKVAAALRNRGHRRILCEAGPHTFGSLLAAGEVDQLFLTTSPFLVGASGEGGRFRLVEDADLVPPLECRPLGIRRNGSHLFVRYAIGARAD